jgi:beta-glucosidase
MNKFCCGLFFGLIFALTTVLSAGLPDLSTEDSALVKSLLKKMTLEEKIGQMNLLTSDRDTTGPSVRKDYLEGISSGRVGAIFNAYGADFTRKLQKIAVEKTRLKIPLLFGYDVIHGHRTIFPISLAEVASFDLPRIERASRVSSTEASAEGIHWTFAPMVDIARDPRWGRISEGAGESVYLGSQVARARVRGIQGGDLRDKDTMLACVKHFAAYGAAQAGRDYHTVDISDYTLWSTYLPPFKAALDEGAGSIMTAFNELNGVPATGNSYLLSDILKTRWGFKGFVVTDYTSINEMVPHGYASDLKDGALIAVNAGVDMDMQGSVFLNNLKTLVDSGVVPLSRIDDAVTRILEMKARLGLFDDPFRYCDEEREKRILMQPSHLEFARDFAKRCVVLLRNEDKVLPLSPELKSIALIGPLADDKRDMIGSWSAAGEEKDVIPVLSALKKRLKGDTTINYSKGCEIEGTSRSGFADAILTASKSDVIVAVLGEGYHQSGEAACRTSLGLPGVQQELLRSLVKIGKPIVLVVMSGRPLALQWEVENIPAIVQGWFLGTMAGEALVDVLVGDHNPSARMPVTTPRNVGQIPIFHDMKNTGRPVDPKGPEEKYKSRYLDVQNEPLFPFGYGLSYTSFAYSDISLSSVEMSADKPLTVSVNIKNTGQRSGDEVVQLYLRDHVGSVTRPVRELKAFKRVSLRKGQHSKVSFTLTTDSLAFLRRDMTFGTEPGRFTVYVGPNAAEGLSASFNYE